jgi:hypothetical protein
VSATSAHIQFFFRPRGCWKRLLARLIGAPTCGIVRSGPQMHRLGDPYEIALPFVAPDHVNAELVGLATRSPHVDDLKAARSAFAREHMSVFFKRMSGGKSKMVQV